MLPWSFKLSKMRIYNETPDETLSIQILISRSVNNRSDSDFFKYHIQSCVTVWAPVEEKFSPICLVVMVAIMHGIWQTYVGGAA